MRMFRNWEDNVAAAALAVVFLADAQAHSSLAFFCGIAARRAPWATASTVAAAASIR